MQKKGGSGRGWEQAESLGMPQFTLGPRAPDTGAGSQTILPGRCQGVVLAYVYTIKKREIQVLSIQLLLPGTAARPTFAFAKSTSI